MEIKQVVIHELIKQSGTTTIDTNPADKLLSIDLPLVGELVAELNKLYGTKGNNAIYGTFSRKNVTNEFPNYTDQYLKDELDDQFMALSIRCMAELTREASAQQSSTGGYIVFARYKEKHDFLLIAMIKDKQGLQVNDDLEPVSITSIDLSKIHQAARINLSLYGNISNGEADLENDEAKAYLSFVSPRTNHDVSGYFIKALDCSDGVPSGRATKNAFTAVDAYCQTIPQLKPLRPKARDSLMRYLDDCLKTKVPATLAGIEHTIRQIVPAEMHHLVDGFAQFANSDEHQLPDAFGVNAAKLKTYTRIISKNPDWDLSFQRRALGTDENSELRYDMNTGLLTIRCSEDLKKQIEAELNNIHENQ
jgi:nucleoid-associated protein